MKHFDSLPTEQPNPDSKNLDQLPLIDLVRLMNREDARVPQAIARVAPYIAKGVETVARSLARGGRLFLAGAGTSGRLCVMEAAECPPTFGTAPETVQAIMAGGNSSVFRSKEGAEDRAWEAEKIVRRKVRRGDVLVGVAASGVTPFALAALNAAKRRGAATILVTCNFEAAYKALADVTIAPRVGPEVLTGSTRLKAGTTCKMALNMLTTLAMVRLGKVYKHWMVDLQPRSTKLVARGLRLIRRLGGASEEEAPALLKKAGGRVKTAIVMARRGVSRARAEALLKKNGGFLHKILR
jgi:N-acetylmuramic acid 6-phosphate etherase